VVTPVYIEVEGDSGPEVEAVTKHEFKGQLP
jgi:hypothetical protein